MRGYQEKYDRTIKRQDALEISERIWREEILEFKELTQRQESCIKLVQVE